MAQTTPHLRDYLLIKSEDRSLALWLTLQQHKFQYPSVHETHMPYTTKPGRAAHGSDDVW
jgi:hypothetical protein